MSNKTLVCYNLGCGQNYDPSENKADSCRHHSGVPVFHDAYKGWSCCSKKCIDFTEFLNIKGCTISCHSNVKPAESLKPRQNKPITREIMECRVPKLNELERPPFETPLVTLKLELSESLSEQLASIKGIKNECEVQTDENVPVGTNCKNNSCKTIYEDSVSTLCQYHPGYPVFHEGLKFWSCCTKRTTDFDVFLNQVGCTTGSHVWFKKKESTTLNCRLDWHQTGSHIYVTIFGKKCDPYSSKVQLSPIRLKMSLHFPEQGGSFVKDMELKGITCTEESTVWMTPSKVEIKLKKKEAGSWSTLELPRKQASTSTNNHPQTVSGITSQVENVDLSCI